MTPYVRVLLLGGGAVLVFDAVASLASVALSFPYWYAAIGSCVIYLVVGGAAARYASVRLSALAGALVGLVDATLGWAISWVIGPGRAAAGSLQLPRLIWTAAAVSLLAGAVASVGAALGHHGAGSQKAAA